MVKLAAPVLSLDASGKLGGAVVFSKWKGRNYARALVTPSNPQSGGQVGMRQMLAFLSQYWSSVAAGDQSSWDDPADEAVISQFNAYVGANLKRWRNFTPPGMAYPIGNTGTVGVVANEAATAGVRQITIDFDITTVNDNWGLLIFRSTTTGFNTAFTNLVHVEPALSVAGC